MIKSKIAAAFMIGVKSNGFTNVTLCVSGELSFAVINEK